MKLCLKIVSNIFLYNFNTKKPFLCSSLNVTEQTINIWYRVGKRMPFYEQDFIYGAFCGAPC